jgi:ribonuclease D
VSLGAGGAGTSFDFIQSDDELKRLTRRLDEGNKVRVALDIEGENNLHSYGIRVSLIQGFDGKRAFIVDALAIRNTSLFTAFLQESSWLKVMFDTTSDMLAFQHALGVRPRPIIDLAVASRLLNRPGGLHALVSRHAAGRSKDSFQKANWLRRPVSRDMLEYAVSDVLPLLDLADELFAELARKGLLFEFLKENGERQNRTLSWNPLANFGRIPGYQRLGEEGKRLARILWYAREYYARRHDLSPENVATKQQMRRAIDDGLRDPQKVARLFNEGRNRNRIDPGDFAERWAEAERDSRDAGQ